MAIKIYYSHPMELDGAGLIDDSGKRAKEARELLGKKFEVWIPEEHQADDHQKQEKIDLDALRTCDVILVDFHHFKMEINGARIYGQGTNQEIGFAKGLNIAERKKRPIVQILRNSKNFHCFDVEGEYKDYGVEKNCTSLEEACGYIKGLYRGKR